LPAYSEADIIGNDSGVIMKRFIMIGFLIGFCSLSLVAQAPRLALVIGNAAYEGGAALKNPVNDAIDIAKALSDLGWNVTTVLDADRRTMIKSANAFRDNLAQIKGSTALFFYAGHGMQLNGENYLVPVKTLVVLNPCRIPNLREQYV
jgi:uncharacterized protein